MDCWCYIVVAASSAVALSLCAWAGGTRFIITEGLGVHAQAETGFVSECAPYLEILGTALQSPWTSTVRHMPSVQAQVQSVGGGRAKPIHEYIQYMKHDFESNHQTSSILQQSVRRRLYNMPDADCKGSPTSRPVRPRHPVVGVNPHDAQRPAYPPLREVPSRHDLCRSGSEIVGKTHLVPLGPLLSFGSQQLGKREPVENLGKPHPIWPSLFDNHPARVEF